MSIKQLLKQYDAIPLSLAELPKYDQESLLFFTNENIFDDPFIDFAWQQDISAAVKVYDEIKLHIPQATLTAFLFWSVAQSLCSVRQANFRKVDNEWFELKNPPFFMPVGTGLESRIASYILTNVKNMSFGEFVCQYNEIIQSAKRGKDAGFQSLEMFNLAHNLVNIPHLRFTNVKPQSTRQKGTQVWCIFGQRYKMGESVLLPISVRMHHANGDPVILGRLMETFTRISSTMPKLN